MTSRDENKCQFPGAFHHCLNRGHGRERIPARNEAKTVFLNILAAASRRLKIRVLAYCLLDNHYHLVIENSSGCIADFFKLAEFAAVKMNALGSL